MKRNSLLTVERRRARVAARRGSETAGVNEPSERPVKEPAVRPACGWERDAGAAKAGASISAIATSDAPAAVPMARGFLKRLTPLLKGLSTTPTPFLAKRPQPDLNHALMLHHSHNEPFPHMKRSSGAAQIIASARRFIAVPKTLAAGAAISITTLDPFRFQGSNMARVLSIGLAVAGALTLAGCQFIRDDINRTLGRSPEDNARRVDQAASQVTTIGVNAYLWRASLDTLAFAPLAQSDSNGGVIVTEWYTNPQNPTERAKVSVAILDRDLRADALRVTAARQTLQNGQWVEAPVTAATVQRLEEIILTRARDLRRAAIAG